MMVISLGSALAKLAAALIVPALCASRGGWRSAAWTLAGSFGAFNLLWQLLARELPPPDASTGVDADTPSHDGATLKAPATKATSPVASGPLAAAEAREPTIAEMFFAAPFQTIIWSHSIKDLIDVHTFQNWAPTFLHLQHGVPLGRVGAYLLFPSLCSIGGKVLQAPFESQLTARGVTVKRIRKLSTVIATVFQLAFATWFVVARSALTATVAYCLMTLGGTFHYSGLEPNYVDGAHPHRRNSRLLQHHAFARVH
jgi:hypothetical protein